MIRVSDFIVNFLVEHNILQTFSVVGGGSMHLNDAFHKCRGMNVIYNHHEQACAMACCGYAKATNKIPCLLVTTGPGGLNALTGVAGAHLDSMPMIVISGQVRYDTSLQSTDLALRQLGDQEFNIVPTVKHMTNYSVVLKDKQDVLKVMQEALYHATTKRKGCVWIDVLSDVASSYIDPTTLQGIDEVVDKLEVSDKDIDFIVDKLKTSKKPLLYLGSAIRSSGSVINLRKLIKKLGIDYVTSFNAVDVTTTNDIHYMGRAGIFGNRSGNLMVSKSDLVIALGSRLSIRDVGYNYKNFCKNAYTIMVDIDNLELIKPTLNINYKINCDVKSVIDALLNKDITLNNKEFSEVSQIIKKRYLYSNESDFIKTKKNNVYNAINHISSYLESDSVVVSSNGSCCVVGSQVFKIKEKTRFIMNSAIASMGYGICASIGASKTNKRIICLEGDGSIQMNIQELQTIKHHNLNMKIIVFNNNGYHSIKQTQSNHFNNDFHGLGPLSKDLSFPDLKKIANAYDISFIRLNNEEELLKYCKRSLNDNTLQIVEVMVDNINNFTPRVSSKKDSSGKVTSCNLEDMTPLLDSATLDEVLNL